MIYRLVLITITVISSVGTQNTGSCAEKRSTPNIVFILADDIGYGDFGCYGATKIKTPNVDRLAREGVRFTDAHAPASVCTPTRYAFITGQYAWRHPAGAAILSGEAPLAIDTAAVTTPSLLKQAGYATGVVGKWHIGLGGKPTDYNREIKPGPLEVGFDYAFIIPATGDRVPCVFVENHRVVGFDPSDPIKLDYSVQRGQPRSFVNGIPRIGEMTGGQAARWKDDLIADTLAARAVKFIEEHRGGPFFLYLATHDIHVPRVPHARWAGTSQAGVRGDVVQEFDGSVGQVLDTLERLKLADNTLVIITSDNGGVLDANGPDTVHGGTVATNNGHAFNGPLRGVKGSLYEGGHREPFLARWPGHIKPGTTSDELICLVDMLATFAAVAGQPLPEGTDPDSFNVLPALLGQKGEKPLRDHLIMQTNGVGRLAIRQGPWKFIPGGQGGGPRGKAKGKPGKAAGGGPDGQLYNLASDLGETTNVAGDNPEIVARLRELLKKCEAAGRTRP